MINKSSQKIFNNSLLYAMGTVFSKAVGFFLVPIYTNYVSDAEYGVATTITTFVSTFGIVIMLSLRAALIRFYNDYDEKEKQRFVGTLTCFVTLNAIVICLLLCLFNNLYRPFLFKDIDFYPLVFFGILSLGAEGIYLTYQSLLQAKQDGKGYSINSMIYLLIHAVAVIVFVWALEMGALGIVLANFVTNAGFAVYGVISMFVKGLMRFAWDKSMLIRSLKYSLPILPHNLSNNLNTYAIKLVINNFIGYALSGLYSLAAQFSTIISLVQSSINLAFRPWFIEQMDKGEEGRAQIKFMSVMIMAIYSFAAVMISLFCKEIVLIMAEESYSDAWKMVPFFIISQIVAFIYYSHVQALMYNVEMSKYTVVCSLSGLAVNIGVSLLLVGPLNVYGVLIARFVSQAAMAALTVVLSRRAEKIDFGLGKMILYVVLATALAAVGMFISSRNAGISIIEILLKLVVAVGAFMLFIFPYRKDFAGLLKGMLKRKSKKPKADA
ncbi:MAG: lipopolysaccharide biosynthesis protein [Clostridia bacterium]|nr:lipopolysaccharide biosynthesis protein [Clostridia bacterium]